MDAVGQYMLSAPDDISIWGEEQVSQRTQPQLLRTLAFLSPLWFAVGLSAVVSAVRNVGGTPFPGPKPKRPGPPTRYPHNPVIDPSLPKPVPPLLLLYQVLS